MTIILSSCGGGNQNAVDDFFNINGDDSDDASLVFDTKTFVEGTANDGTIENNINVTLVGRLFEGTAGEDFVGSKVTVTNLPAGFTLRAIYQNDKEVQLQLTGTALSHANSDDISNLNIQFETTAFNRADGISSNPAALTVNFKDPYTLSYNTLTLNESGNNDGTIGSSIIVSFPDYIFNGSTNEDFIANSKVTLSNIPAGLVASARKSGSNQVTVTLTGTASSHTNADDITNLGISFQDAAFPAGLTAAGVGLSSRSDLTVNFYNPAVISYSPVSAIFTESGSNIGAISNQVTISISEDTFTGNNGDDFAQQGKVNISNIPSGLTASLIKVSNTALALSLNGNAVNHANANDINNIGLSFNNTAFGFNTSAANVVGSAKNNIAIDYDDPYTISFNTSTFLENGINDGTIATTVSATLAGTTFTGANSEDFVATSKISVSNVPAGLTVVGTRVSTSQIDFTITGTASAHASANNIANLAISFSDSAFVSGAAAGVTNSNKADFSISYLDPVSLSYSGSIFNESASDDGSITNFLDITLTNDLFTGSNGENFLGNGKANIVPGPVTAGLTTTLTKISDTVARLQLVGNASVHNVDITGITLTFSATAFSNSTSTVNIVNAVKNDIAVNFYDQISYSTTSFNERAANDGQIDETSIITLTGTQFTGTNGENFVGSGKVTIANVPVGLTPVVTKNGDYQVTLSFTGTAANHASINDISNISLSFNNSAFASGNSGAVANSAIGTIGISYLDPVTISYNTSAFNEAIANDGSIGNTIDLTLAGDSLVGSNGQDLIALGHATFSPAAPSGLTVSLVRNSSTTMSLTMTGNASVHDTDQGPFTLTFNASAFVVNTNTSNIVGAVKNDIIVNYNDALAFSTKNFTERAFNDGQIGNTVSVTLTGISFTGSNSDDFVADGKVTLTNVPVGLTATMIRNSATQLTFSLTGTAASHTTAQDVSNMSVVFQNSAFSHSNASSVANYTSSDFSVSFLDPVSIAYSGDTFTEPVANDGSVSNTISVTLTNDTLVGSNGDDFVADGRVNVTNIPVGLTARIIRNSATTMTFSLTGNAGSNDSDISNIGVSFLASAFTTTTDTSNVTNAVKNDFKINYYDLITYSTKNFTERALNDGAVTQTANISLTGANFAGNNGDNFVALGRAVVSNVPSGLTPVLVRNSVNQLTLSFTGAASSNESADSVSNLTINFIDSAFSGTAAASIENSTVNDINLNFFDSVALSYSTGTFDENLANDGSISNSINITLVNDTFTGTNGENYLSNSKANISNLPAGLSATLTKTNSTTLTFSLSGNAVDNGDIHDIANLTLTINPSALTIITDTTNVLNATKSDIIIDYISPSSLTYDTMTLIESSANNGTISSVINIDITGLDNFTGTNGENFISTSKVSVTGVPAGLTAVVEKTATKQVRLTMTGTAVSNDSADSISNVRVTFNSSAFVYNNDITLVTNYDVTNVGITYYDTAVLTYSAAGFTEAAENVGEITQTIDIDLANDTYGGTNGENFLATGKATISNTPSGLTPTILRIGSTKVRLSFTGNAIAHADANDISNLTVNFQASAFSFNTDTSNVTNANKNNITVDFLDPYTLSYSSGTFNETIANTGATTDSVTITLTGTTFTGSNGDNFVSTSKVLVSNVPAGLTPVITRDSSTQLTLSLTGTASVHANANDVSNLTLAFQNTAFTSNSSAGVTNNTKNDFSINFIDPYSISYDTETFDEAVSNIGEIGNNLVITLTGHQFSGSNSDDFILGGKIVASNVPAGLTVVANRNSATEIEVSLTGNATNHANADDISNLALVFQDTAFTSGALASDVVGYNNTSIDIDYVSPYTLTPNGFAFDEDPANDGSISDTINYTVVGTTFAGANSRDLVSDGDATVANVPAGLTAVLTKQDSNNVVLSLSGNATVHASANDISNLQVTFLDGAFTSGAAAGVNPSVFNSLTISFDDPPNISYSLSTFTESSSNIGATTTSLSIFLANKTFNGSASEDFVGASKVSVTGYPVGLTPVITYISPNQVNFTFTGNATSNDDADDISNGITVIFNNSAFVGGNAAQVVNSTYSSINFDFEDPYQLTYSSTTFTESSNNDGSIGTSLSLTLVGTLFNGTASEDFIVSGKATVGNLPAGLTAQVVRLSSTLVQVNLTGNASVHSDTNDISNFTINFLNGAFTSGAAAGVTNASRSDISIDYYDPASLSYASSTFNESVSNIGLSTTTIDITLTNDVFTGPNGENFIATGKVSASNSPSGMTPAVTKISNTVVRVSLTGAASNHANINDVSNLGITFQSSAFSFNSDATTITDYSRSNLIIDFIDPYTLAYASTTFTESAANDGSIGNTAVLTLSGTTFNTTGSDFITDGKTSFTNVPAGLTPVIIRDSASQVTISFTGNASSHLSSNDISNMGVVFADSAFVSGAAAGVDDSSRSDLSVDFNDPPGISYASSTFNEATSNIGAIATTIDITLTGDTFTGTDGAFYTPGSEITFSNTPAGLTAVAQKIDATTVRFSFTGNATGHTSVDSISNFTVQFNNAAFNNVSAANILNNSKSDFNINFINPYSMSFASSTFSESVSNIGVISTTIDVTVVGTTFTGADSSIYTPGSQVTFTNTPAGLTAQAQKIDGTTVRLSFTGAASAHANVNDITNFSVAFNNAAFTSGAAAGVANNSKSDFTLDFIDPYSIIYSAGTFDEASANDGSITTAIDVDLTGTTFTGADSSIYTPSSEVTFTNTPAGLTAQAQKISSTKVRLSFTGAASAHANANDITNFSVAFNNLAFTSGAAAGVANSSKLDFIIDFREAATLAYSTGTFNEAVTNIGAISNTITITLANDVFTGSNGENYIGTGKASISNVPSGLSAALNKTSATTVDLILSGTATTHINASDISNLQLTFNASSFTFNSDASTISNYDKSDIIVDFIDPYVLAYSVGTYTEAAANDGSIGNTITLTLTGTTFNTTGSDFISDGKLVVSNVPTGLTAVAVRDSATQMTLSLTGTATNNLDANDVSNLTYAFADTAFASGAAAGVTNANKADIIIDFEDQPSLAFAAGTFNESAANIGAIGTTIDVTLTGATFTGADSAFYTPGSQVTFTNTPAGLTAAAQKIDANTVRLSFTGTASSHAGANSISNFTVQFNNAAFNAVTAANVGNSVKADFNINFISPYIISYASSNFSESSANIGAITTTIDVTLSGTTFTGINSAYYTPSSEVTFTNTPGGLTAQAQKISDTVVRLSFTGTAASHANANDITNFTVTFNDSAFTSGASAGVTNSSKSDFTIDYIDPYYIVYSGSTFIEDSANDGSITTTIDVDLTGTTFTGADSSFYTPGVEVTFANTPGGLTARAQKISSTKIRLSFSGSALAHTGASDIANFSATFNDSAFTSNAAAGVTDSSKTDFAIDFRDPAALAYDVTEFDESNANTGALGNVINITLSNDTFTGSNGENFIGTGKATIANVPSGLTATLNKVNSTTLQFVLSGSASNHADTNDVSNLRLTFLASAFDFNTDATSIVNYDRSDLVIDFVDPYDLSYSSSIFAEAAANDGSIGNTIVITLTGTTFTTPSVDLITDGDLVVSNVPTGLSAVAVRDSATQVTLSLTGNATNNLDANDISNLAIAFQNGAFASGAASGVDNASKADISVDFNDQPSLSFGGFTLTENVSNTGTISGQIDITITGDTFSGSNLDIYTGAKVGFTNVPAGLGAQIQKINNTTARLTYTGTATNHAVVNNLSNIEIAFTNAAFDNVAATNIASSTRTDLGITFRDPYVLSYSGGTFSESAGNDGSIITTVDVDITGTTFTGATNAIYSNGTEVSIINTPAGLTAQAQKIDPDTIRLSFTGNATAHDNADDITNWGVTFNNAAFTSGAAAGVQNTSKLDFVIDYSSPASLSYSGTSFIESNLNNGAISTIINIDIVNDTFTGAVSSDLYANGDITINNVPANLTATATKTSATRIAVALTGNATNHADTNDISNLEITFLASAFTNNTVAANVVGYSRNDLVINFDDPYVLTYASSTFTESSANDGSIANTITVTLTGTTFTGTNGSNYQGTEALVTGIPAGLTAVVNKDNSNQVTISLTGTATTHDNGEDIANLSIAFQDSAFTSGAAAGVDNSTKSNLIVDFADLASIAYSSGTFSEGASNTGTISTQVTVTLSNDTFTGGNGDNFAANGKATISNVPGGLTAVLQRTSDTTMTLDLIGTAGSHANAQDISNLTVAFNATAFTFNSNASLVTNSNKNDFIVDFNDPYSLAYSAGTLSEATANDGSVVTVIDIDLTGTTFTGTNTDNFAGTKAIISNVPTGLTAVVTRTSGTQVQLSLTGNATNNENSHDVSNLTVIFQDSAFTSGAASGVTNSNKNDLIIDFVDKPVLAFSTTVFNEAAANIGGMGNSIVISLSNELFATGAFDASKVTTSNIPAGLTASFTRDSDTQLTMNLTGSASNHASANDLTNIGINFLDAAFQNVAAANITNSSRSDLAINFLDPYQLTYASGAFAESLANDGSIANTISISLSGTTFTTPAVNMIADGDVTVNNVPIGFTAVVTRDSATQVTFSLSGNASSHLNADDRSNLEIIFNDSAFVSGAAAGVLNNTKSNFVVDYQDPASIAYSGASFPEAVANDGSITTTIDLDLTGDTFTGSNSDNFTGTKATITNFPAGLTPVLTKISDTKLRLSFTGTASSHANSDDISNLTVTLLDSAFTNNAAAINVTNYSRSDLAVDFADPAVIAYSSSTFSEDLANNGTVSNTLTLTLSGDSFTGSNGENYVATSKISVGNVPTGLQVVGTKTSNTVITLSLTGIAAVHANSDDISNLTITFNNTAFTNNASASNVTGYTRGDLIIDYQDPATLSYSASTFTEDASNNGVTSTAIVITLSGDTFTGSNSDDFVSDSKITPANVPANLTMVATRDSATQITLTLSGTASNHLNADDIANLTVEFEDSAFTNNSVAANITNYNRTDLAVDFNDPAVIAYGSSVFTEDVPNDGSIVSTVVVTLTGDTFTGTNGENFVGNSKVSVANTPGGLTAVVTRNSATQVTISFSGFASSHVDLDDIANFGVTFNANAFNGNTINTNVTNYQKLDFDIDFNDPYAITYSSTGFIEAPATDDGSMDQPLTVNIAGTQFTGTNGDNLYALSKVAVTNFPAGLTPRMIRTSATTATFYLDGQASVHNDAADISNLTVVFDDSAFAMNNASLVADSSKNDLIVDFFVTPVNAPTDLLVTDSSATTISLSWTDNSNNEANFRIERCDGVSCDTTFVAAASDAAIAANTTTYTATGLSEGVYYKFRVLAENADVSSAWAAGNLTIAFGGGTITDNAAGTSQEFRDMNCYGVFGTYAVMSWTNIGANNYLIYDDTSGTPVLKETLSAGTTSYVIDSLDFGSAESWRVVANMGTGVVSANTTTTDFTSSSTFAPCNVIGNDAGTYHATGATHLYDPRATFIYDGNLFVSDTNNARVLIYNSLPTSKDDVPDVVLGQDIIRDGSNNAVGITNISYNDDDFPPSFSTNDISANMLRCPEGIWVGDVGGTTKVVIADRCTHRVLIWDGIPSTDNAPADIVVGKTNFTSPNRDFPNLTVGLDSPYDVYSDGTRLAIADTNNDRIVIHNTFPTSNGKPWDVCLGAADCSSNGSTGQNATSIQDPRSVLIAGGKLLASTASDDRVLVWNDITTLTNNNAADIAIGQSSLTGSGTGNSATTMRDPWGLTYDGTNDRLYITDSYNCRVLVYEGIPTVSGDAADYALGETDALTTRRCNYSATRFHSISDMALDESSGRAYFTNYGQDTLDALTSVPTTLAAGITKAFQINTDDPTLGLPNYGSEDTSGTKNRFMGVTMDNTTGQFFASDDRCDRVLVWNSAPTLPNEHPDYVLGNASFSSCEKAGRAQNRFQDPRGMCIAWDKLFVADYNNRRMMVYNLPISANQPGADFVLGQTNFTSEPNNGKYYLDRPNNCFYDSVADKLLITSENDDVVLVYEGEPTMDGVLVNHAADYIIGEHENAGRTQTRISNPRGVVADGTNVFVADASNRRIMRFPYPSSDSPNGNAVLGQLNYTNADTDTGDAAVRQPTGLFIANNKLYTADRDFNRIIYWNLPLTQTFYQSSAGLYGHEGDYDYVGQYESSELQEGDMWDMATDGKRIFGVDLLGGRIIITPLREN